MTRTGNDGSHAPSRVERNLGIGVLGLLLVGCFLVMQPFLTALAWAFVLAFSLWPVHRAVVGRLGGRRTFGALVMTGGIAVVLVLPVVVTVVRLADDARAITVATREWLAAGPPAAPGWLERVPVVGGPAAAYWRELSDDAARLVGRAPATAPTAVPTSAPASAATSAPTSAPTSAVAEEGETGETKLAQLLSALLAWARVWLPVAGLAVVNGAAQVGLSVFLTFFIFRDGEVLAARLNTAGRRIAGERAARLLEVAGNTVRGVVYGILGTACVQGAMAGFGFLIAGVPGAVLLGFLTFVLSVVPMGPPLVWIPASLWLFHRGAVGWGVFWVVWGIGVSTVDNVVKPYIISRGSAAPFLLVLFGVIGGAMAFGFIGVFLGPTLLAVAYRLIGDWVKGPVGGEHGALPRAVAAGEGGGGL